MTTPANSSTTRPAPIAVGAADAAAMLGVSRRSWARLQATGRLPAPRRLGARVLWGVDELRSWWDAGCPDQLAWKQARQARTGEHSK